MRLARETNGDLALVMPRWGGWTSDLGQAAQLFISYYPERAEQMRLAAALGRALRGAAGRLGG